MPTSHLPSLLWLSAGLLVPGACAGAAAAGPRANTVPLTVKAAQVKLIQAEQALEKAREELDKAQLVCQTVSNKVQQARQIAAQKHGAELGMNRLISERDAAWRQLSARRKALEPELKALKDFQTAEKEADAARQRLGESPDQTLSEEQQKRLASDLAAKIRQPTEMRKEAEAHDPELQQATQRWQTAGKKIAQLQPQLKKAIDTDPAVLKPSEEARQAALALEKARTASTRAEQDLSTAQSNLDRNQQMQNIEQNRRNVRRRY